MKFNNLVNSLKASLVDSENPEHKVKWSIPTINITIPEGEFYFNGFDVIQGLNLKGAGKNVTIIKMLEPAKIKYKYQQTLENGVGHINISDIFFFGNLAKNINCFEPSYNEDLKEFSHLIYSNIHDCIFYGFNEVFKLVGYNNNFYNNTFNWCNRCFMIYGFDGNSNNGGDWAIHHNSANNVKEFITSTFSSLIHAYDNWCYQGLGCYINLLGWNRGAVIENNRLEFSESNIMIHGGFLVCQNGKVYQKISNNQGALDSAEWQEVEGLDATFIEPYVEEKSYNILQAISIMIRNNNLHSPKNETIKITGGQYITIQDNFSGNYVKQTAIVEGCQGLKYHNNLYIDYEAKFYDDFRDWRAINSFNVFKNLTVGTPENYGNFFYNSASPNGISFRINDKKTSFTVLKNGGVCLHNNGKVATLAKSSTTTIIEMDCINSQSVVIMPRNQATATWYAANLANIFVETGNGNVAITHPQTTENLIFNILVV